MKKVFQKIILGFFVTSFLFAPIITQFSQNENQNINLEIKTNTANAQTNDWWFSWVAPAGLASGLEDGYVDQTACDTARSVFETEHPGYQVGACENGEKPVFGSTQNSNTNTDDDYLICFRNLKLSVAGCIASFLFTIQQVVAWIAEGTGRFLDFFVYYSINSDSYKSPFVEQGWAIVRDIANIFFIIALLFVAIKTVLSMNVANNKRLVGVIIVIALLINFSLFTTKVVIDASNILAKIFYNNILPIDKDGKPKTGEEGEKSISLGIIKSYNPQQLLSKEIYQGENGVDSGAGKFIFLTLVLIFVTLYTAYIFIAVALLFVARVISLWLAMIFAPIAFASYTMPFDIPGFGHRSWWPDLMKNAFLAPFFIFFLYLIIMFLKIGTKVTYTNSDDIMIQLMSVIIPFIITVALLMKAKDIAVKMSGEMGQAIMKGAKIAGGFALGAATGGAAMLGSGLIGGGAAKLMNSKFGERLKSGGYTTDKDGNVIAKKGMGAYFSRMALKTGDSASKASFDIRQTKLGQKAQSVSGMNFQSASILGLGSKQGGYQGSIKRGQEKQEKEKELYKTNMSNEQVKAWSDKRRAEYFEGLDKARKDKKGNPLTGPELIKAEKAYKAKNGEAPKAYNTAEELNKDRLQAFKENLGHSGLLGSIAYEFAKGKFINENNYNTNNTYQKLHREKDRQEALLKEGENFREDTWKTAYEDKIASGISRDDELIKQVNNEKINETKMVIGGAAVLGGVVTGGLVGGFAGTLMGGGIGGGAALSQSWKDSEVEKRVATGIDTQNKNLEKINARIKDLNDLFEKGQNLERIIPSSVIGGSNIVQKLDILNPDKSLNKEKLRNEIANNSVMQEIERNKLKTNPNDIVAKDTLKNLIVEEETLKGLTTVEERLYDLTGKKANLNNSSSGNSTPTAPPTPPPSTP